MCIFQCDESDDKVATCLICKCLVLGRDILKQSRIVEFHLITSLFERDAKDLFTFDRLWHIVWIDLYDVICALTFLLEYLQSLRRIVWCYHAIANLALYEESRSFVASIAKSNEVAIRAHAVSSTGTSVSACYRRQFYFKVIDEIDFLQSVV